MENPNFETLTAAITAFLRCIPMLVWQIIVISFLVYFRKQIAGLFDRISRFKVGDTEVAFQPPARDAPQPRGEAEKQIELLGPDEFLTRDGIAQLVENSGLIGAEEKISGQLLLFRTGRQHTWLVATSESLFCVLDDEDTRVSGKLIQWKLPLEGTSPVKVVAHKPTVGLVSIGPTRNWLYSRRLHPSEDVLKTSIEALIKRAKEAA